MSVKRHKRVIVLAMVVCFILGSVLFFPAKYRPHQAAVISGGVIQEFSESPGEDVRVFVKLKDVEEVKGIRGIKSAWDNRVLEKEKKEIMEDVDVRYDFGDMVSVELSEDEVNELAMSNAVESVELVGSREIFLSESVPLINADDVWGLEIDGVELTGEGETVCILDTGIDYNHADLVGKFIGGYDFANDDDDPMDDHNHGTHVAGTVAANGVVKGVAPGANLAAVKVCTGAGVCYDDDIIAGINWCADNSDELNISVISMSLGGGVYSEHCNDDPLASVIGNVVNNSLVMVVASGNHGSKTGISAPACVETALPVGSTTKSDVMSSFSNRNSLLKVVAPGSNIYSTIINGHGTSSGTSMATPHISGVIALIRQYERLKNLDYLLPSEIENLLSDNGILINDSAGSGLGYSRVDVLKALTALESPETSLSQESDELICNGEDVALVKGSFYLWNITEDIVLSEESEFNTSSGELRVNISSLEYGLYEWNCEFEDNVGLSGFANENASLIVSDLEVVLDKPIDMVQGLGEHEFVCNASSSHELVEINVNIGIANQLLLSGFASSETIEDSELFHYNKTYSSNVSGLENSSMSLIELERNGNYTWSCNVVNSFGKEANAEAGFVYDSWLLNVDVNSPLNASYVSSNVSLEVEISHTGECSYSIENISEELYGSDNLSFNANVELEDGDYEIGFDCTGFDGRVGDASVSFGVDSVLPVVTLGNPGDGDEIDEGSVQFSYTVEEDNLDECVLWIDDVDVMSNNGEVFDKSMDAGDYVWMVSCVDLAGNEGNSSTRALEVAAVESSNGGSEETSESSGGSGGGGGGGSSSSSSTTSSETNTTNETEGARTIMEEPVVESPAEEEIMGGSAVTGQAVTESNEEDNVASMDTRKKILWGVLAGIMIVLVLIYWYHTPLLKEYEKLTHKLK